MFSAFSSLNTMEEVLRNSQGTDNQGCVENSFRFITSMASRFFGFKASVFTAYCEDNEHILAVEGVKESDKEAFLQRCLAFSKIKETQDVICHGVVRDNSIEDILFDDFIDVNGDFFICHVLLKDDAGKIFGNLFFLDEYNRGLSDSDQKDLILLADQAVRLIKEQISAHNLKLLNDRLLANIKLLNQIQQSNNIGYWCLEIASGKTEWSDLIYDIYEVDRDFVQSKENGLSFYHPDYVSKVVEALERCISSNEPFDIQCLLITAKGNQKWVRSTGFKNDDLIYGSFQDISAIKENELKFEGIFNTSASLIWFLDLTGLVLDVNATASEIMGDYKSNIQRINFWDCPGLRNTNKVILKSLFSEVINGQEVNYQLDITTKDNQLFPVIFSLRPILNQRGVIAYVLAEARPIKELVEKTKRYEAIIQGANVGTWEWDIQTGSVLINQKWAEIIGYELEELVPMDIEKWRELIHPDDLPLVNNELSGANWRKKDSFDIQMRVKHKLGHWVWVVDSGKVLDWSIEGSPVKMYGIHRDHSQVMKDKEELERLLQTTQHQNERQNQFTSILSHNLKLHGAAIIGLSELLMHDFPELAENEMFQLLLKGANDLNETINDVNEILKIRKQDDLYKEVLIAQLIDKIISSLQFHINTAQLKVECNIDKAIKVWTIEPYLASVIQNLITNAIKFKRLDKGAYLKISYQKEGDKVALIFEDNGLGIDLNTHGKDIFGLYKTFHRYEKSKGLGLYMSKQQVEMLGGALTVKSAEGLGSTFTITLPI